MFNLLYMDCRRLVKSRGAYAILGVTVGLLVLLALLVAGVSDPGMLDAMQSQGAEMNDFDRKMIQEIRNMSQLTFARECLGSGFLTVVTGIGMALFVSSDFSSGYIKNICFARPRRWSYVLSKALLAGLYSGALTVAGVLVTMYAPLLFGMRLGADPVWELVQYVFWMWLPHWTFALMAMALVLLTGNSTLSVILAVVSGSGLSAMLLQTLCRRFQWPPFDQYLISSIGRTQCIHGLGAPQMGLILACAVGWGTVYVAGSLLAIGERDL